MLLDELGPRAWWLLLVGLLSAAAVAVGIERSAVPVLARPAGWTGRVGGRGRRSEATLSSADSRHIRVLLPRLKPPLPPGLRCLRTVVCQNLCQNLCQNTAHARAIGVVATATAVAVTAVTILLCLHISAGESSRSSKLQSERACART